MDFPWMSCSFVTVRAAAIFSGLSGRRGNNEPSGGAASDRPEAEPREETSKFSEPKVDSLPLKTGKNEAWLSPPSPRIAQPLPLAFS